MENIYECEQFFVLVSEYSGIKVPVVSIYGHTGQFCDDEFTDKTICKQTLYVVKNGDTQPIALRYADTKQWIIIDRHFSLYNDYFEEEK